IDPILPHAREELAAPPAGRPETNQRPEDLAAEGKGQAVQAREVAVHPVTLVTGEELVAAVAGERHGDGLAGELREEQRGNARDITEGLIEEADDLLERAEVGRADDPLVVIGAVLPGRDPRVAD